MQVAYARHQLPVSVPIFVRYSAFQAGRLSRTEQGHPSLMALGTWNRVTHMAPSAPLMPRATEEASRLPYDAPPTPALEQAGDGPAQRS